MGKSHHCCRLPAPKAFVNMSTYVIDSPDWDYYHVRESPLNRKEASRMKNDKTKPRCRNSMKIDTLPDFCRVRRASVVVDKAGKRHISGVYFQWVGRVGNEL